MKAKGEWNSAETWKKIVNWRENKSFDGNAEETRRIPFPQPGRRISGLLWWVSFELFLIEKQRLVRFWIETIPKRGLRWFIAILNFTKKSRRNANSNKWDHMSAKRRRLAYTICHVTCGFKTQATIVTIWSDVMTGSSRIVVQSQPLITSLWILFANDMESGNLFQSRSVTKHLICSIWNSRKSKKFHANSFTICF